jgi:hypothetical protein
MRGLVLLAAISLGACATPIPISGRYASSLSQGDVQEIRQFVATHRSLGHPVRKIEAIGKNRVRIVTGQLPRREGSWSGSEYSLARHGDRWIETDWAATAGTDFTIY